MSGLIDEADVLASCMDHYKVLMEQLGREPNEAEMKAIFAAVWRSYEWAVVKTIMDRWFKAGVTADFLRTESQNDSAALVEAVERR